MAAATVNWTTFGTSAVGQIAPLLNFLGTNGNRLLYNIDLSPCACVLPRAQKLLEVELYPRLKRVILPCAGWSLLSRSSGEIAMKALSLLVVGLAVAVLSASAANAEQPVQCSWSHGIISPVPRHKRMAKNYEACRKYVMEHGETAAVTSWWCTSQGYKD
ncbi:MAG TPA: hypothetical protein VF447_12260 [Terriglobales bacterium]